MIYIITLGGFIILAIILTLLYIPVLKYLGVKTKVLNRSVIIGSLASASLVLPNLVFGLLQGRTASGNFVSAPSILISIVIVGLYLKKNLTIKTWKAFTTSFLVTLVASLLLAVILVGVFTKWENHI